LRDLPDSNQGDQVEAACAEALSEGVYSADVILNILARRRDPGPPLTSRRLCKIRSTEELRLMERAETFQEGEPQTVGGHPQHAENNWVCDGRRSHIGLPGAVQSGRKVLWMQ
jgi:hypothetical protein